MQDKAGVSQPDDDPADWAVEFIEDKGARGYKMVARCRLVLLIILCWAVALVIAGLKNEVYDVSPPPAWMHVPMTQTVKAIAGIDLAMSDRRQEGHIDISCGGHPVPAAVVAEPTEFGQTVTIRLLTEYWLPNPVPASGQSA